MKVLFIGGTGIISSACSALAVEQGHELYHLNRGTSPRKNEGVTAITVDVKDAGQVREVLKGQSFDVVVDWIGFRPADVERDLDLFRGRTGQYIYISSASVYEKPVRRLPITENTPLGNPFWQYSRDKIACEERLMRAFEEEKFPVTIVRPSYTYDRMTVPVRGGYTVIDRMKRGRPVVINGDGTSLWVLTHHRDFALGFTGLMGNPDAVGEAFHITSDELLTWDQIHQMLADAAGTELKAVHVPSEVIARYDREWGASLLGDKCYSTIFDNSKIKRFVPGFRAGIPFSQGVREIMAWYNEDPARQNVDGEFNRTVDEIVKFYG